MNPIQLKKNTKTHEKSFFVHHAVVPHFYDKWHFHLELELNYIIKGSGTRFIGDSIEGFSDGDMVLVGSNLPHVWKNDKKYYQHDLDLQSEAIFFHFLEDFAGTGFFAMPELKHIQKLLDKAQQGVRILGETRTIIGKKMQGIQDLGSGERLIELLSILNIIANSGDQQLLSSEGFMQALQVSADERINKVYAFTMKNFLEEIPLEKAAEVANMNPSAFCRFFKSVTKKTFVQFLTEIRLGYACKLLADDQYNVSQICYECGFNNISNFNRRFKSFSGKTPQEYRLSFKVHK